MKSPYHFAKEHAFQIQHRFPDLFEDSIGIKKWKDLTMALNIKTYPVDNTEIVGRLEMRNTDDRILYNSNLTRNKIVQTIGHEIGHWILKKFYPELDKNNSLTWKEAYANHFANELCIPFSKREIILKDLNSTETVKLAIEYSNKFCIPIAYFFRIMSYENNISECSASEYHNIWILGKWGLNQRTKLDAKFRVFAALYDRNKYYIPENQGVQRIIGDMEWLSNLQPGIEKKSESNIYICVREKNASPEYKIKSCKSFCSAFRLIEKKFDDAPQMIVLIKNVLNSH
jgi:Zn-dependent peptidase ImmA (M78 family)